MAAKTVLRTAVILSAVDKMSSVVNRVFKTADKRLVSFQKRADAVAKKSAQIGKNAGAIGLGIAAPLMLATKQAINFEESMADVSKVLNLKQGSKELNAMGNEAQNLAIHLARSPKDAAALVASLAQGGTAKDQLFNVAKFAGEMAVAFDIAGESAGDSFTKTQNALGTTINQTKDVMNAVNLLSDNQASKAAQILTSLAQGGAASARSLKLSGQEAAAIGSMFIATGKSGSEAGTLLSAMARNLGKDNAISKLFRAKGGGLKGIVSVLEAGNKLSGAKRGAFFSQFGLYGTQIALAAENTELLQKSLGLVADKSKAANSVALEFANRSNTRAAEIAATQARLQSVAIKVGNVLLPIISELTKAIAPMLDNLAKWIEKNPVLTSQIVKGVAVLAGLAFATSGVAFAVSGVARTLSFFSGGLRIAAKAGRFLTLAITKPSLLIRVFRLRLFKFIKVIRLVGTTMAWLGRLLIANPIGIAIAAIAGAAFLVWKHWGTIKPFFIKLWADVSVIFNKAWEGIKTIPARFYDAGKNLTKMLWEGMKYYAGKPVEMIQKIAKKIRDFLPFSPAKTGPLADLHRVRIVETIAATMKPAPAINAMRRTAGAIANVGPTGTGISGSGGGGGVTIMFQPSINIGLAGGSGGNIKEQIMEGLREYADDLLQMIEEAKSRSNRTKF